MYFLNCSLLLLIQMVISNNLQVAIYGTTNIGKTQLFNYLTNNNEFDFNHSPTIGVDMGAIKNMNIKIWDLSGDKKYEKIIQSYINRRNIIIYMFDLSEKITLYDILKYHEKNIITMDTSTKIILVGNKCDIRSKILCDTDIDVVRDEIGAAEYFEVSCKNRNNLDQVKQYLLNVQELNETVIKNNVLQFSNEEFNKHGVNDTKKKCLIL